MRGTKAKALRREAKERGETPTRTLSIKDSPGPNRAERRMEKFKPNKYADLQLEHDPAARRTLAKRWIFAYSPKLRAAAKKSTAKEEVAA